MTNSSVPSDQIKLVQLDPAWERQVALEQDMQRLGIERIRKQMVDAKERGEESSTRYGRDLLSDGLEPVSKGVQDYLDHASTGKANRAMQYAKHLYGLEPETVAYFALSSIINYLFSDIALVGMAKKIGTLIDPI
jgi:DNA-directed RNA polymerase